MDVSDPLRAFEAVLGSATRLFDLVSRIRGSFGRSTAQVSELREVVATLQEEALAAKESAFALREENLRLKDETEQLRHQARQRAGLVLQSVGPGAVFYTTEGVDPTAEGTVRYCQACADDGKKAALQFVERKLYFDRHECPRCRASIQLPNDVRADVRVVSVPRRFEDF